jgi:hypothetical protein
MWHVLPDPLGNHEVPITYEVADSNATLVENSHAPYQSIFFHVAATPNFIALITKKSYSPVTALHL